MWICKRCYTKNNNSNKKCHGPQCNAPKPTEKIKQEQKQFEKTNVRDFCPKCKSHQDFTKVRGKENVWICARCHKKFKKKGKPVPEPVAQLKIVGVTTDE